MEMVKRSNKTNTTADVVAKGVQVGKSKVFLHSDTFEALEVLRNSTMNKAAVALQARTRAFICQNKFYLILGSVLTLQCFSRKLIATLQVNRIRCHERSITIQKYWRSYHAWSLYQNTLFITTWCQRFWRANKVREQFAQIKQYRSAIIIQSAWRSHAFQQCHQELRNAAIVIQCFYRTCFAAQMLQQLKREARDVKGIAMERDRLRMQMKQMQQELDSWTTSQTSASQDEKIRALYQECAKKDQELQVLRQEVESLRGSGRSVPSTLPLTVTVDTPLSPSKAVRSSPADLMLLPSSESSLTKSTGLMPASPSLLDSAVEGLPQLECSQVSLPGSSVDISEERLNVLSLDQTTESSFIDCNTIEELPFHHAVVLGDLEMLLIEIHNTSDIELGINAPDSKGRTPLHIAAQCSNVAMAKSLLSHCAVVANTQDFSGNTALHYSDSPEMTHVLLEGGISPNIPNGDGFSDLY